MSWLVFNVLSGVTILLVALFLKLHLFKTSHGELTRVNNVLACNLKRTSYPIWEFLLVFLVCCIPIANWIILACQLLYVISSIKDKDYVFCIVNLDGVHNDKTSLNNSKEQWIQAHKFQYKLYKGIKDIFTFNII